MNRYLYGKLETSSKLNSGPWEEQNGTDGEEMAKKRMAFLTHPYSFTKKVFGEKRSGYLKSTSAEIDSFLHNNLKDLNRDGDLTDNTLLIRPEAPTKPSLKQQDQHLHPVRMVCLITLINGVFNCFVSFGS